MFHSLVLDAVNSVTLPLFSRKHRDGEEITAVYLRALAMITGLGWSFLACLAIAAFPIMRILYGNQWDDAVNLTRILCLFMAIVLTTSMAIHIMISKGMAGTVFKLTAVVAVFQVLASFVGSLYGMYALGWMLAVSAFFSSIMWIRKIKPVIGFAWQELASVFRQNLILAALTALPFALMSMFAGFDEGAGAWLELATAGVAGLIAFLLGARYLRHPLFDEIDRLYRRYAGVA
jgi:O-antigen/teichoic acid export membrane protein